MASRNTLGTGERLKREKDIEALFRTGKAFSVFPLRFLWRLVPATGSSFPMIAGFTAPKRNFRKATDRNRVKRLLREAWRLQKSEAVPFVPEGYQLHIFMICSDHTIPDFLQVQKSIGTAIQRLAKLIEPGTKDA